MAGDDATGMIFLAPLTMSLPADKMTLMDLSPHIIRDPKICGGEPVFRGTRVTLRTVLASLADGDSVAAILRNFPTLTEHQINAAIAFAAASAQDDLPIPELPAIP
jgi:uncharacterized protein (DUF433 family)